MLMAPLEVLLLLASLHFIEMTLIPMLILDVGAVSTILIVVPGMVVAGIAIVVALFVMVSVFSSRCDGNDQGGAERQRAQYQEPIHVVFPHTGNCISGTVCRVRQAQPSGRIPRGK